MSLAKARSSFLRRLSTVLTIREAGPFVLLALFSSLVAFFYVSGERFYYFWDWGGFQVLAVDHTRLFFHSPQEALVSIGRSLILEYNYLYVLPLIPAIRIFGYSRLGYILSVALVYQIPFALCIGGLAVKLISGPSRRVFWSAAAIAMILPAAWIPTLRGYPDVGGALLVLLAALLYLQDVRMRRIWRSVLIGLLLALAVIFRRHFAYWVVAFYLGMVLQALVLFFSQARKEPALARNDLIASALGMALTGLASLALLATLGNSLLLRVLHTDYLRLYQSYALSPGTIARFFLGYYGWVIWAAALLPLLANLARKTLDPGAAVFLLASSGFVLVLWIFLVRQSGPHYTLQVTPLVVLGLAVLVQVGWETGKRAARALLGPAVTVFLLADLLFALAPLRLPAGAAGLFSANYPPLSRSDFDEIGRLVAYLREIVPPGDPIYVADSSLVMNPDILVKAEQRLYGVEQSRLDVLLTPQIDSRDFYPLEPLLEARYVLFSTPFQRHVSAEEQKVVQVVSQAFLQGWDVSRDFTRLPQQFNLGEDAKLSIYQRTKETSTEVALQTYEEMRSFIRLRPGSQPDWILLNQHASRLFFLQDARSVSHYRFQWSATASEPDIELLFSAEMPEKGVIKGQMGFEGSGCSPAVLGYRALEHTGIVAASAEQSAIAPAQAYDFAFPFQREGAEHLIFFLRPEGNGLNASQESCILRLDIRRVSGDG